MDPLHPITPGPPPLPSRAPQPVERLARITRERDRPAKESPGRKRRKAEDEPPEEPSTDEDGRRHIDVRV